MKINTYAAYKHATPSDLKDNVVIIIDVLRATSSIVTAIDNGCSRIYPVTDVEDAMSVFSNINKGESVLLGGENSCQKISGFHLSNSPSEYTKDTVQGKDVILTTTNGTGAILWAAPYAHTLLIGSLLNATAVMKKALSYKKNITLLCAGTGGRYSTDDILACGCMLSSIEDIRKNDLCDLSISCINEYELSKNNIKGALEKCYHFKRLKRLGFKSDLEYCIKIDSMQSVPIYKDSVIIKDTDN